jgi:hypothetical protein
VLADASSSTQDRQERRRRKAELRRLLGPQGLDASASLAAPGWVGYRLAGSETIVVRHWRGPRMSR